MKKLLPFIILLLTFGVLAQKTEADLNSQIKTFKKSDKYKVAYDKFKDVTNIRTEKYLFECFGLSAAFSFAGKEMTKQPENIALIFTAYGSKFSTCGDGWRFLKDSNLTLLIDTERVAIGSAETDTDFARGMFGESMTKETLLYKISIEDLEKMSKAKTIEFQIAKEEGKFNKAIREMLANLYQLSLPK